MKTSTFKQNYHIDSTVKAGVRGVEKRGKSPIELTPFLTADHKVFDGTKNYFFFDGCARQIRESSGLSQMPGGYLGANNIRVVAITMIYLGRDNAISAAQAVLHDEIAILRRLISKFEMDKTPTARSLKTLLDGKNPETSEADFLV